MILEPSTSWIYKKKLKDRTKTERKVQHNSCRSGLHYEIRNFRFFGSLRHIPNPREYKLTLEVIEQERKSIELAQARRYPPCSASFYLTANSTLRPPINKSEDTTSTNEFHTPRAENKAKNLL